MGRPAQYIKLHTYVHIKSTDKVWDYILGGWNKVPVARRIVNIPALQLFLSKK